MPPAAAWLEYAILSNQLVTPRILACPADAGVKVSSDFTASLHGGLLNATYRANAVSYFIGLHADPQQPLSVVAGDRNLRFSGVAPCSLSYVMNADVVSQLTTVWTNEIHGKSGNLLLMDGHAETTTDATALQYMVGNLDDNSNTHVLRAR